MTKKKTAVPNRIAAAKLIAAVKACDGHSIVTPEFFTRKKNGALPMSFLAPVIRRHRSNESDPKQIIWKDGQPLLFVEGIYMLDLLYHVARYAKVDTSKCGAIGRGFLARQLQRAILDALEEPKAVTFVVEQPLTGKPMKTIKLAPVCDKCGKPNDRADSGNYCSSCAEEYHAKHEGDPEYKPVGTPAKAGGGR